METLHKLRLEYKSLLFLRLAKFSKEQIQKTENKYNNYCEFCISCNIHTLEDIKNMEIEVDKTLE